MAKQYYNNTQPGETSLESRSGAKVVMDSSGSILLTSVKSKNYLEELRKNNFIENTSQNPDEDSSYLFIGEGNVDLNNQGSTNQDSLSLVTEQENYDIIEPNIEENIVTSLPVQEPLPSVTPPPSPTPTPTPLPEEEVIIESLPDREFSSQDQLFDNLGAGEGTGLERNPTPAEVAQTVKTLETKTYSANNGKSFNIVVKGSNGKSLSSEAQAILDSCYDKYAVNAAIKMNPTNYSKIINNNISDGKFAEGGIIHSIIQQKYPGTYNAYCAAGLSTSFQVVNKYKNAGGFPAGASSQIIWNVPGVVTFIKGEDYIEKSSSSQGNLTSSGITKFNSILNFKGAVIGARYTSGFGHIGMILGAELVGNQGYLYCLDFNLSSTLKFNRKRIGGNWGVPTIRIGIGPTAQFSGGAWAPSGLSNSNIYYEIGDWKTNKSVFK